MIKAITFDVDQTLVDLLGFKKKTVEAMVKAIKHYGFKGAQKKTEKELYDFYLSYGIESDDFLDKFLRKKKQYSNLRLAAGINAYLKTKYASIKAYPKVKQTLRKLVKKGIRIAIVTDAPKLKALMRLEELKIADMFEVIVSSEDVRRKKPSTLLFRKAVKTLGLKPEEVVHIGDCRDKDVLGAKKAGMQTCIARYGDLGIGRKVWADFYIDKFEDVLKIV